MRRIFSALAFMALSVIVFSGCTEDLIEEQISSAEVDTTSGQLKSFQSGTHDGFYWQLWRDTQSGTITYTNGPGGNYSVRWSNFPGNFTAGKGWATGSANRRVGYNIGVHTHNGGGVIAFYGWTRSPLIEYYVNERWGTVRPTGTRRGSVTTDGGTYDIFTATRTNAPSIDGTQTFQQVFSTRTSMAPVRQNRTITFANHVNAWRNAGLNLGTSWSYAIMLTEAYGSSNNSGHVNLTVWAQ